MRAPVALEARIGEGRERRRLGWIIDLEGGSPGLKGMSHPEQVGGEIGVPVVRHGILPILERPVKRFLRTHIGICQNTPDSGALELFCSLLWRLNSSGSPNLSELPARSHFKRHSNSWHCLALKKALGVAIQ